MNNRREINVNWAHPWTLRNGAMVASGTIIRQGVFCGSKGCIFHPAETIKNSVRNWANVPVTLNHPMLENALVAVSEKPEAVIGHLENPIFRNGALMADIVITTANQDILQQLQNTREVSTGMFSEEIPASGIYDGKDYTAISQFYVPDHLALLPQGEGACSWERGECGIGLTVNEADTILVNAFKNLFKHLEEGDQNMEPEMLLPPGACTEVKKEETEQELLALQEQANEKDLLLPTQFNATAKLTKQAAAADHDLLLPAGIEATA